MRPYVTALLLFAAFSLSAQDTLKTIQVQSNSRSLKKSLSVTANTTVMTSKELLKAACCNLAESFETNPSIDVNFADALTGAKQIKMLGLTSPYLMITEENIPSVRGASQAYGMTFTPGTWVESIQVTKGAGSVVNGFESISGQINTELLKPINETARVNSNGFGPFFLNVYGSTDSRFEINAHISRKISRKWASSLFIHGNSRLSKNDMNDDGFLDSPLGSQINVMNRWQYADPEKGWVSFISARFMNDEKQTGQVDFNPATDKFTTAHWGSEINTTRYDVATKIGYVFPDMPFQSVGFQNALSRHEQDSYFGFNRYDIAQTSYYSNLIFNSIIDNTMHKFAAGVNFSYDKYDEYVLVPGIDRDFDRADNSVGAFFEYTYDNNDNFSAIIGVRADNHNRLGSFVTPRLHLRYNPWEKAVIRASAGRGKRAANIFAENQQLFASSRTFSIQDSGGKLYGLDPETAWNYGVSFNQKFTILGRSANAGFDLYRTDFTNQAVVDWYSGAHQVNFYNLDGKSVANSFQADFEIEPVAHLNVRTAYKYYDVRTQYAQGEFERPLQAKHRFFANAEFTTDAGAKGQKWKFDTTWNWTGSQRLPDTSGNPEPYDLGDVSSAFSVLNAQATRVFSSSFEIYAGAENIGNYKQKNPVLGADAPFGPNFDASIVYAPIFGRMFYAGLRLRVR